MAVDEAAGVIGVDADRRGRSCWVTRAPGLRDAAATDVLIIEDEPIIAMDLEELVQSLRASRRRPRQHGAGSRRPWLRKTQPGLILADINLGSAAGPGTSAVDSHPA